MFHLEDMDFGRRLAVEKELEPMLVSNLRAEKVLVCVNLYAIFNVYTLP